MNASRLLDALSELYDDRPLLACVLDERTYPTSVRVGAAAGAAHGSTCDPDHAYEFGLQGVLDASAPSSSQGPIGRARGRPAGAVN